MYLVLVPTMILILACTYDSMIRSGAVRMEAKLDVEHLT